MRKTLAFLLVFQTCAGAAQAALPGEPAFVRAHPEVSERLETLLIAAQQAGVSPAARPARPTPCSATDSGASIRYTWTDVAGETGYYVYQDGLRVAILGSDVTEYVTSTVVGTHSYCVLAYNADGVSDPCCDEGSQTKLATPSACSMVTQAIQVSFTWSPSLGAELYRVYRDGSFLTSTASTSILDTPNPGQHEYCVEATATGFVTSDQCCASGEAVLPPLAPASCEASQNLLDHIHFSWSDVEFEAGYTVLRDGQFLANLGPNVTAFDDPVGGRHEYCVRAFNQAGASPSCCSFGAQADPTLRTRLSWGTCSPQVNNQTFTGPGPYTLVLSLTGSSASTAGHDSELRIQPAVPEAWRFDDAGCQTGSRLDAKTEALGDSCAAMLGPNPLPIISFYLYPDGSAGLRLAVAYDDFPTDPSQRYVLWKIVFDHSQSFAGDDSDPGTCDGAAIGLNFRMAYTDVLLASGPIVKAAQDPNDQPAYWNGGIVRTRPMTWGRVKGLYR